MQELKIKMKYQQNVNQILEEDEYGNELESFSDDEGHEEGED